MMAILTEAKFDPLTSPWEGFPIKQRKSCSDWSSKFISAEKNPENIQRDEKAKTGKISSMTPLKVGANEGKGWKSGALAQAKSNIRSKMLKIW